MARILAARADAEAVLAAKLEAEAAAAAAEARAQEEAELKAAAEAPVPRVAAEEEWTPRPPKVRSCPGRALPPAPLPLSATRVWPDPAPMFLCRVWPDPAPMLVRPAGPRRPGRAEAPGRHAAVLRERGGALRPRDQPGPREDPPGAGYARGACRHRRGLSPSRQGILGAPSPSPPLAWLLARWGVRGMRAWVAPLGSMYICKEEWCRKDICYDHEASARPVTESPPCHPGRMLLLSAPRRRPRRGGLMLPLPKQPLPMPMPPRRWRPPTQASTRTPRTRRCSRRRRSTT